MVSERTHDDGDTTAATSSACTSTHRPQTRVLGGMTRAERSLGRATSESEAKERADGDGNRTNSHESQ